MQFNIGIQIAFKATPFEAVIAFKTTRFEEVIDNSDNKVSINDNI